MIHINWTLDRSNLSRINGICNKKLEDKPTNQKIFQLKTTNYQPTQFTINHWVTPLRKLNMAPVWANNSYWPFEIIKIKIKTQWQINTTIVWVKSKSDIILFYHHYQASYFGMSFITDSNECFFNFLNIWITSCFSFKPLPIEVIKGWFNSSFELFLYSGFFLKQQSTKLISSRLPEVSFGGSLLTIFCMACWCFCLKNGGSPSTSSIATIPSDQMSTFSS